MSKRLSKLELERVLQRDAAEIVAARKKAQIIHRTQDIDIAGNEVERAVRNVIRRKLPTAYYVGHGHVVDSELVTSPQLDVIIADNTGAPILFQKVTSAATHLLSTEKPCDAGQSGPLPPGPGCGEFPSIGPVR